MNIFDPLKTCMLLGKFSKNIVKSVVCNCAFIECELVKMDTK